MSDEEVDDFTRKLVEFMQPIIREFMEANFEDFCRKPEYAEPTDDEAWVDDDLYGVIDRAMQRSWTDAAEYEYAPSEITAAVRTWMDEQCFRRGAPADLAGYDRAEWIATLESTLAEVYTILKPLAEAGTHGNDSPILRAYNILNAQDFVKRREPTDDEMVERAVNAAWSQFQRMPSSNPSDYAHAILRALEERGKSNAG